MTKKIIFVFVTTLFVLNNGFSQSYYFGIKGGPTFSYQKWETFNQSPLLTYHIASFIESYSDINPMNSLYAQLGFHNRGSAWRGATRLTYGGDIYRVPTKKFLFRNISLGLGAKRKQQLNDNLKSFYSFGIRAEYTIATNLDEFVKLNQTYSYYFPDNGFVKKFVYGAQVGGGLEFYISELIEGLFEITVNPDLSNQYDQPEISGVVNPYHTSNTITLRRRRIKNTSIEITVGIRFMRKVEYID